MSDTAYHFKSRTLRSVAGYLANPGWTSGTVQRMVLETVETSKALLILARILVKDWVRIELVLGVA